LSIRRSVSFGMRTTMQTPLIRHACVLAATILAATFPAAAQQVDHSQHGGAEHAEHMAKKIQKPKKPAKKKSREGHSHLQHGPAPPAEAAHADHTGHGAADPADHAGHGGMKAFLGPYPLNREASGTSWQPDTTPHEGIHGQYGDWSTMAHAQFNFVYDH